MARRTMQEFSVLDIVYLDKTDKEWEIILKRQAHRTGFAYQGGGQHRETLAIYYREAA
jgi:hypothetical protein